MKTNAIQKVCFILIALMLTSCSIAGANSLIPMLFKSQYPPGVATGTHNCGQTSSLMVFCKYNGAVPSAQGIMNIDDWLYRKYGDNVNGYNGQDTNTAKLETLAREYGGFPSSYKATLTIDGVKQKIDQGYPVIVAVNAGSLSNRGYPWAGGHFVVAKGYDATHIIANDPGTVNGESKYYLNSEFAKAMSGGCVIVVPNIINIKITSPISGNYWPKWTTQKVQWRYNGNPSSSVSIDLLQGTNVIHIASNAPLGSGGVGSYSWLVSQPTGQYRVRVTINASGMGYTDTSGIFYIG